MNRKEMIEEMTAYELRWLADNFNETHLEWLTAFFADGGYTKMDDTLLAELCAARKEEA